MFKRWQQPEKAAIRVRKTYDGIDMPDSYVIRLKTEIEKVIEHIEEESEIYERNMAREDNLSSAPKLTITKTQGLTPNEPNILVLAELHYTYTTPPYIKKKRHILPICLLVLLTIIILNIIFGIDAARKERINTICKVYYLHGEPTHIILNNREFDLNNMSQEDFLFINPWDIEELHNTKLSDCLIIKKE
jgi:hypothetical protein